MRDRAFFPMRTCTFSISLSRDRFKNIDRQCAEQLGMFVEPSCTVATIYFLKKIKCLVAFFLVSCFGFALQSRM